MESFECLYTKKAYVLIAAKIFTNIGSCNDLVPDGTKPLSEPPLTCFQLKQTPVKL